jgi:dihydrofolate reductase
MRKIIVGEFISLDGVMQAPGGADEDTEGGFTLGGWTWPYWHDDIGGWFMETQQRCDAYLLGRKTWQIHGEAFEPQPPGDPFFDMQNGRPKYVVSTTLSSAGAWRNSTVISSDVPGAVRRLKDSPGAALYIDGSHVLVHTLAREGLIDEYNLLVFPVVLGQGKRVFPAGLHLPLKLEETRSFPTGVQLLRYTPSV